MDRERSNPPADWTEINPEVVNIASTRAMMRHELTVLITIAVVIPITTLLGLFPLYFAIFIGFLCVLGALFFGWIPLVSIKQTGELPRYLSWIFATQPAQARNVLLKPYPVEIAYRPVGLLLIAEIYGEENQLQHEIVVTVPDEVAITKESLNVRQPGKIHYDPETHDPVVIDLGTFRCWRAPGFASPPQSPKNGPGAAMPWRWYGPTSRLHPTTASVIWVVLFGFCLKFFISPDAFMLIDGRGAKATKWGFIDANGQIVIKPTFDGVSGVGMASSIGPFVCRTMHPQKNFHEGLAAVCVGKRWGFIDKTGKFVVRPQFDEAGDFSEGLACVVSGDKCGFIDQTGNVVMPMRFDRSAYDRGLMTFKNGLCVITATPYSTIYIDKKGKAALSDGYMDTSVFSEGLALIELARQGNKFIDNTGKTILSIPAKQRGLGNVTAVGGFSEGYVRLRGYSQAPESKPRFWFIDKTGKPVSSTNYATAKDFSDGLAAVVPLGMKKYGYIDQKGQLVIQPAFESPGDFREGLAPARLYHGNKENKNQLWGFIDKTGAWVVQPQFSNAQAFSEGRAAVRIGDSLVQKEGYIDKTGRLVIPANYYNCFPFSGNWPQ